MSDSALSTMHSTILTAFFKHYLEIGGDDVLSGNSMHVTVVVRALNCFVFI